MESKKSKKKKKNKNQNKNINNNNNDAAVEEKKPEVFELPLIQWNVLKSSGLSVARAMHALDRFGDQLFVFGGTQVAPGDMMAMLFKVPTDIRELGVPAFYDCAQSRFWTPPCKGGKLEARTGHTVTVCGNKAYIIGGSTNNSSGELAIWSLNFENYTFQNTGKKLPFGLKNHRATAIGSKIYIFGGKSSEDHHLDTLLIFDTQDYSIAQIKQKQSSVPCWPPVRSCAALGSVSNRFLVLFGGDTVSKCLNDLWIFDTVVKKWYKIAPRPAVKTNIEAPDVPDPCGMSCGFMQYNPLSEEGSNSTHLILCGGVAVSGGQYRNIWALDVNTLEWMYVPTVSGEVPVGSGSACAIVGDKLYCYGGYDETYSKALITMSSFDIGQVLRSQLNFKVTQNIDAKPNWQCRICGGFTERKCSKCKQVPLCSDICEEKGSSDHEAECAIFGGVEDPVKRKMREFQETVDKLQSSLDSKQKEISTLTTTLEQNQASTEKYQQKIKAVVAKTKELHQTNEMLQAMVSQKEQMLSEKEQQQTNSSAKNEGLASEIEKLKSELEELAAQNQRRQATIKQMEDTHEDLKNEAIGCQNKAQELSQEMQNLKEQQRTKELELLSTKSKLLDLNTKFEEKQENDYCTVCSENVRDHALSCGHCFCLQCIQSWIAQKQTCPICRQKYDAKPIKIYLN